MLDTSPGAILQNMYLKNRLLPYKGENLFFYDVGAGTGSVSRLLLSYGFSGIGIDLNQEACDKNKQKNSNFIKVGRYKVVNGDFFKSSFTKKADIIISSMFLEHLTFDLENKYFDLSKSLLNSAGLLIIFAPSSNKYWGIEDELNGHFKRYDYSDFKEIAQKNNLKVRDLAGLTYPLSNVLFPLSNFLIKKFEEKNNKNLTIKDRTILSGNRNVFLKTSYPDLFKLFLNEITLYPFYILQNIFRNNSNCMIIYCELGVN